MKSLIIQPSGIENPGTDSGGSIRISCEPVGATYISEYLRKNGHESEVYHQDSSDEKLLQKVADYKPEVVGFSTMTFNFNHGRKLAERIKREYKNIPIVFGGYQASALPLEVGSFPEIDYVVVGEGEKTIVELFRALEGRNSVSSIEGIVHKEQGNPIFTGRRARIKNLDEIPFPLRKELDLGKYKQKVLTLPAISGQKSARVHTSRGCRFSCPFCSTKNVYPGGWFARSPEDVVKELEYLKNNFGTNAVFFGDEDPFANPERLKKLFKLIQSRGLSQEMYFRSFINARDVEPNRDLLEMMHKNGYVSTFMGIEAFNDEDLRTLKKGISTNRIVGALKTLDKLGIITRASHMIGYPFQDESSLKRNLDGLLDLPIQDLYLPIFTPFPGTSAYREWKEGNYILTENWNLYDTSHVVVKLPFESERLLETRDKFLKEFYGREKYQESIRNRGSDYGKALDEFLDIIQQSSEAKVLKKQPIPMN